MPTPAAGGAPVLPDQPALAADPTGHTLNRYRQRLSGAAGATQPLQQRPDVSGGEAWQASGVAGLWEAGSRVLMQPCLCCKLQTLPSCPAPPRPSNTVQVGDPL